MKWHKQQFQKLLATEKLDAIIVFANNFDDRFLKAVTGFSSILQSYLVIKPHQTILVEPKYLLAERKLRLKTNQIIFHPAQGENFIGVELKHLIKLHQSIGICGACKFTDIAAIGAKKIIDLTVQADQIIQYKTDGFIAKIAPLAKKLSLILKNLKISAGTNQLAISQQINQEASRFNCQFSFPLCITSGTDLKISTCLNPKNKIIKTQDVVCIDLGLKQNGLITDITRTFFINHLQAKKLHNQLFKQHLFAVEKINPKMTFPQLMDRYEKIAKKIGGVKLLHQNFGHGLGFAEHEPPMLEKSKAKIGKNIIFTIEPTFKTKFGLMRFEDMVAVDSKGKVRNLTKN